MAPQLSPVDLAECRTLMRGGSRSFFAASLLLPRAVREPACALYAFCRLADDAIDGAGGRPDAVDELRARLDAVYAHAPRPNAADRALAAVVHRYGIPRELPAALIEGFEWDAQGRAYETFDELTDYAARVAGTVGAMMALLMGVRHEAGLARACDLGVAMQLSNIARDVAEDAAMGRLYLPRQWLREAGVDPDAWLARPSITPALLGVVQRLLDEAQALYRRVDAGHQRRALPVCRDRRRGAPARAACLGHAHRRAAKAQGAAARALGDGAGAAVARGGAAAARHRVPRARGRGGTGAALRGRTAHDRGSRRVGDRPVRASRAPGARPRRRARRRPRRRVVSPSAIIAVEFALVLAVVLGLGIWQLVSVRREIARDREQARQEREAAQRAAAAREAGDAAAAAVDAPGDPGRDPSRGPTG